jgi:hypothetical protein
MNEEPARDPRLTTATAISVARSLTTCVSRNDALTTEVFKHLAGKELDGNVVRDIFVRFPMWLGYYLESDLKSGKFWAGAQMWVLPPVTAKRRPDCYYEKALPAMARVPFQWRAELSTDGQVCIFSRTAACSGGWTRSNTAPQSQKPCNGRMPGTWPNNRGRRQALPRRRHVSRLVMPLFCEGVSWVAIPQERIHGLRKGHAAYA